MIGKAVLVLCLVAAVAFRFLPVGYGVPAPGAFSSDEIDAVSRALKIGSGDLMPLHFNKPTFYNVALAAVYGAEYLALRVARGLTVRDFERLFFTDPSSFYILARAANAAASTGILLLLLLALRGRPASARLTALVIAGFGLSSVFYAHVAKEDTLAAFFTFAAFLCARRALVPAPETPERGGRFRRFLRSREAAVLAGAAAAGLAVSAKYNVFFAPLFPALALALLPLPARRKAAVAAGAAVCLILAFFAGTPYAALHPASFVSSTLQSTVAAQVAGEFQVLGYAENRGLRFLALACWREFGLGLIALLAAGALFLRHAPRGERLLLAPCLLYVGVLLFSSQLDFQYIVVLTPIFAWTVGIGLSIPFTGWKAQLQRFATAAAIAGAVVHSLVLIRRTAEYLGGDTRVLAAPTVERLWREEGPAPKPFLILTGYYYHYYPALRFDAATYERLLEKAQADGAEGGYFKRAAEFARTDEHLAVSAEFTHFDTGFRRLASGERIFKPQPFSLNLDDYRGRYSFIVVPGNTLEILKQDAPELQPLKEFLAAIQRLPLEYSLKPEPWLWTGPALFVYKAP